MIFFSSNFFFSSFFNAELPYRFAEIQQAEDFTRLLSLLATLRDFCIFLGGEGGGTSRFFLFTLALKRIY